MKAWDLLQKLAVMLPDQRSDEDVVVEIGGNDHTISEVYVDGKGDICIVTGQLIR